MNYLDSIVTLEKIKAYNVCEEGEIFFNNHAVNINFKVGLMKPDFPANHVLWFFGKDIYPKLPFDIQEKICKSIRDRKTGIDGGQVFTDKLREFEHYMSQTNAYNDETQARPIIDFIKSEFRQEL